MKALMFVTVLGCALVSLPCFSAPPDQLTPTWLSKTIVESVDRYARKEKLAVDSLVVEHLRKSATIFAGNLCLSKEDWEPSGYCGRTIGNPTVFDKVLHGLLAEYAGLRRAEVRTLAARLADQIGVRIESLGWPAFERVNFGIVSLSPIGRKAQVWVKRAHDVVTLSPGVHQMLAGPGELRLEAGGNAQPRSSFVAIVSPGKISTPVAVAAATPDSQPLGRLAPSLEYLCYDRLPPIRDGALSAFNWGRSTFRETDEVKRENLLTIAKAPLVDIQLIDETGLCGRVCREGLGVAFANALSIWREGCQRCEPDAFAVIKLGDNLWADAVWYEEFITLPSNKAPQPHDLVLAGERVSMHRALIGRTGISAYQQVAQDGELAEIVCRSRHSDPVVDVLRREFCGRASTIANGHSIRPIVRIKADATTCGSSASFLACGLPGAGIEIAWHSASFEIDHPDGPIQVGAETTDSISVNMQKVVLHEVGHWFGIPHPEDVGLAQYKDIMSAVYGDGQPCISGASRAMQNNATDRRWPYRAAGTLGLRVPNALEPARKPRSVVIGR